MKHARVSCSLPPGLVCSGFRVAFRDARVCRLNRDGTPATPSSSLPNRGRLRARPSRNWTSVAVCLQGGGEEGRQIRSRDRIGWRGERSGKSASYWAPLARYRKGFPGALRPNHSSDLSGFGSQALRCRVAARGLDGPLSSDAQVPQNAAGRQVPPAKTDPGHELTRCQDDVE